MTRIRQNPPPTKSAVETINASRCLSMALTQVVLNNRSAHDGWDPSVNDVRVMATELFNEISSRGYKLVRAIE